MPRTKSSSSVPTRSTKGMRKVLAPLLHGKLLLPGLFKSLSGARLHISQAAAQQRRCLRTGQLNLEELVKVPQHAKRLLVSANAKTKKRCPDREFLFVQRLHTKDILLNRLDTRNN